MVLSPLRHHEYINFKWEQMDENELPKKMLWTHPGDNRGRGRLKARWTDGMEEDTRKLGCRNLVSGCSG